MRARRQETRLTNRRPHVDRRCYGACPLARLPTSGCQADLTKLLAPRSLIRLLRRQQVQPPHLLHHLRIQVGVRSVTAALLLLLPLLCVAIVSPGIRVRQVSVATCAPRVCLTVPGCGVSQGQGRASERFSAVAVGAQPYPGTCVGAATAKQL